MVGTATKPVDLVPQTSNENLSLRICGTSRAGQIIQLKSGKCSIGSGERCTLRVRARSVKPLHCVIFRGNEKTFVRSWSPDTRLNGQSFSDAQLSPGDRIGVGPIEFEVLGPKDKPIQSALAPDMREIGPPAERRFRAGTSLADRDELDRLTGRLVLANQQGRARARRLIGQLRLARKDLLRLGQGATSPATDDRELPSVASQVVGRQQAREEEHQQWEIARQEAERQIARSAEQLDEQMAQIEAQKAALHRQRNEWEASRAEAEEQLVARAEEVDRREAEFDNRLAGHRGQSAVADAASIDSDFTDAVSPKDGPQDHQPQAATNEASTSGEPFWAGAAKDESEASESSAPPVGVGTDAESVQQYMARLLNRVGGVTAIQDAPPAGQASEPLPTVESSDPVCDRVSGDEPADSNPDTDLSPACQAENPSSGHEAPPNEAAEDANMALRATANASAEEAIDRQMQGSLRTVATSRLLVTFLGIIGGIVSTWGWLTGSDSFLTLSGAVTCFAIAGFSGVWYLLLMANKPNLNLMPQEDGPAHDDSQPAGEDSDNSSLDEMPVGDVIHATADDDPTRDAN